MHPILYANSYKIPAKCNVGAAELRLIKNCQSSVVSPQGVIRAAEVAFHDCRFKRAHVIFSRTSAAPQPHLISCSTLCQTAQSRFKIRQIGASSQIFDSAERIWTYPIKRNMTCHFVPRIRISLKIDDPPAHPTIRCKAKRRGIPRNCLRFKH